MRYDQCPSCRFLRKRRRLVASSLNLDGERQANAVLCPGSEQRISAEARRASRSGALGCRPVDFFDTDFFDIGKREFSPGAMTIDGAGRP